MILNAYELFVTKQAYNGNIDAAFKMMRHWLDQNDTVKCAEFVKLTIDLEPSFNEQKLQEHLGERVDYEDMIGVVAVGYDLCGDYEMVCKWAQKYIDYIDIKYANIPAEERQKIKENYPLYSMLKENGELNKIENRFLLKWEQERYLCWRGLPEAKLT